MKLVSVDRALKTIPFSLGCALYCHNYKYNCKVPGSGTLKLHKVNFTRYGACTKQLGEKTISFCSSISTVTQSGVCYQKLTTLEFIFHYRLSSHYVLPKYENLHEVLSYSNRFCPAI